MRFWPALTAGDMPCFDEGASEAALLKFWRDVWGEKPFDLAPLGTGLAAPFGRLLTLEYPFVCTDLFDVEAVDADDDAGDKLNKVRE